MIYKLLLFVGIIFNVLAQISLKNAMKGLDFISKDTTILMKTKSMIFNPLFIFSIMLYGLGFVIYSVVLSKVELSKAYPVARVTVKFCGWECHSLRP